MIRVLVLSLLIAIIITIPLKVKNIHAASIGIGATTWYTVWDTKTDEGTYKSDWALMYGPVVGFSFFDRWNISGVFLLGKFDSPEMNGKDMGLAGREMYDFQTTLSRFSVYPSLSGYYFIYFAGVKYIRYKLLVSGDNDEIYTMYGPSLGLSVSKNVGQNLTATVRLSAAYLMGNAEHNNTSLSSRVGDFAVALSYFIVPTFTTISAGLKYQIIYENRDDDYESIDYHDMLGITFTAVYRLSF